MKSSRRVNNIFLLPITVFTALIIISSDLSYIDQKKENQDQIVVAAYYMPQRGVSVDQLPLDKLTHIIYSFSRIREGEMRVHPRAGDIIRDLVKQKEKYPELKVMVACGGWGADGFSDMAVSVESRTKFAESAVALIKEYNIDGIDMDWEYPGLEAGGIKHRPEDGKRFTLVMQTLREHMDRYDDRLILSFASAGWKRYYEHIETLEVMKYADYMNIMTYDQVGGNSTYTSHHTALGRIENKDLEGYPLLDFFKSKKEEIGKLGYSVEPKSAEKIIDYVIDLGVDPGKILIGGAFYGRSWKGVPPEGNGLYQPDVEIHIGWCSYSRIRSEFEKDDAYTRYWDPVAKAPYLYSPTDSIFVSYDDTVSMRMKTEYAINNKLGGIMFWQLSDDTKEDNSLLDAIDKTVGSIRKIK